MNLTEALRASLQAGAAGNVLSASAQDGENVVERYLDAVATLSPYLGRLLAPGDERRGRVLAANPQDGFAALFPPTDVSTVPDVQTCLRRAKGDLALAIALADMGGIWDLSKVTTTLSQFAQIAARLALGEAIEQCKSLRGVSFTGEQSDPHHGIAIFAMGKLGAHELNYSSDIDLIALYDPNCVGLAADSRLAAGQWTVKVIQAMIDILSDQVGDDYVFRTDLRLRPNPGAMPLAVSIPAAERYYEEYGQNWERAAFIKARFIAGNEAVGQSFLDGMKPFIWRRTLDYGAVSDIRAIKEQIHAERGNPALGVRGGNIKLGPGGIREIEFFVQVQQLLLGGREPDLRDQTTLGGLNKLAAAGHISDDSRDTLTEAYHFLRTLEHRLQMCEDKQTQIMPETDEELETLALMMNLPGRDELEDRTFETLQSVHALYADLFGPPAPGTPVPGSLVFTGVDDDPRTVETLTRIGFSEPSRVIERIRRWHQGGLRATKSARAREILTALVPHILMEVGEGEASDTAFAALDAFLSSLPGGVQLFALFLTTPDVLDDVIALCRASPEMMRRFSERPSLVEGLLEGMDIDPPAFDPALEDAHLEDVMDEARREVGEHRIRAGTSLVLAQYQSSAISQSLANAADDAIALLVRAVRRELEASGRNPPGEVAVLGFGRLGIGALTVASDLDLVFVYRSDDTSAETEQLFTRLIRRIVSALSVPTGQGELFEIDMKLRPSGGAGPAAVSLAAFERYYEDAAWVWEEMALTKARIVYADGALGDACQQVIDKVLVRARDAADVRAAVADMRRRLLSEKAPRTWLDVKRMRGGLTDIEFIVQCLVLSNGGSARFPVATESALLALSERGVLPSEDAQALITAHRAMESLIQYLRATFGSEPPTSLPPEREKRVRALDPVWSDEAPIKDQLTAHAQTVMALFEKLVGRYEA